jgi:hypothetical protein
VRHHRPGGHDGIGADGHTGQDRGSGTDPHIPLNCDRLYHDVGPALVRLDWVAGRDEVDLVRDHDLVGDVDRSVTGERALVADEDGPTNGDIQP